MVIFLTDLIDQTWILDGKIGIGCGTILDSKVMLQTAQGVFNIESLKDQGGGKQSVNKKSDRKEGFLSNEWKIS